VINRPDGVRPPRTDVTGDSVVDFSDPDAAIDTPQPLYRSRLYAAIALYQQRDSFLIKALQHRQIGLVSQLNPHQSPFARFDVLSISTERQRDKAEQAIICDERWSTQTRKSRKLDNARR
jgi:hypothetical protein